MRFTALTPPPTDAHHFDDSEVVSLTGHRYSFALNPQVLLEDKSFQSHLSAMTLRGVSAWSAQAWGVSWNQVQPLIP